MENHNYNFEALIINNSKIAIIMFVLVQILVLSQLALLFYSGIDIWLLIYAVIFWLGASYWIIVRHIVRNHSGCITKIKVQNGDIFVLLKKDAQNQEATWRKITITANTKVFRYLITLSYKLEQDKLFKYLYIYTDMLSVDEHRKLRAVLNWQKSK